MRNEALTPPLCVNVAIRSALFMLLCSLWSCSGHKLHKDKFYRKLGQTADHDGYHANEAKRVLEYNDMNKEANQEHARDTQETIGKDLNTLNKPNKYNARGQKTKKKKFNFYM